MTSLNHHDEQIATGINMYWFCDKLEHYICLIAFTTIPVLYTDGIVWHLRWQRYFPWIYTHTNTEILFKIIFVDILLLQAIKSMTHCSLWSSFSMKIKSISFPDTTRSEFILRNMHWVCFQALVNRSIWPIWHFR